MVASHDSLVRRYEGNPILTKRDVPYPVETGMRTTHAFVARFRPDAAARPHIGRFREWLAEESRSTAAALARVASSGAGLEDHLLD